MIATLKNSTSLYDNLLGSNLEIYDPYKDVYAGSSGSGGYRAYIHNEVDVDGTSQDGYPWVSAILILSFCIKSFSSNNEYV